MLYDCHVHTRHSGHSKDYSLKQAGEIAEKKAIVLSIREHAPFPAEFFDTKRKNHFVQTGARPITHFALHSETIMPFFREVAESGLSLGFEVDILPGFEKETEGVITDLESLAGAHGLAIDAVNGSHHIHNGRYWELSPEILLSAIKSAGGYRHFISSYFGQIRDAIRTGFYDAISHLEFLCRFNASGSELEKLFLKSKEIYAEELAKTLLCVKEQRIAVEYNTSGFDYACKKAFLSGHALHFAYHMDVPLVIGSDTHALEHIGRHFDFAVRQLKEYGISHLHYFKQRKRISYSI